MLAHTDKLTLIHSPCVHRHKLIHAETHTYALDLTYLADVFMQSIFPVLSTNILSMEGPPVAIKPITQVVLVFPTTLNYTGLPSPPTSFNQSSTQHSMSKTSLQSAQDE